MKAEIGDLVPGVRRLRTARDECGESAVALLRELLAAAEAGEIITVTGVAEDRSGGYRHFGSSTMSRLQTAGALLEASINRLQED